MGKKQILFIIAAFVIIGILTIIAINPGGILNKTEQAVKEIATDSVNYSKDIVYNGNHFKADHAPYNDQGHLYLSLSDLEEITDLDTQLDGQSLILNYQDSTLTYQEKVVQNSNLKEDEINEYQVKGDTIFIPDRHIEKFLGIQVDYYLDKQTNTISLLSPAEQQKENYDQEIGSTIFLHRQNVPLAKYEPRNGIYLGGYVIQDEYIDTSMNKFNQLTGKEHASYFRYVGYGKPFPTEWVNEVIAAGGFPQIAWEPNNGLEEVQDDEYLRQFAKDAASAGVPVLLRYASEMNGTWTAYSGNQELYIQKWKLVHNVMEEEAPNVMMLWNVFTMPEGTIEDFYPGDDYVDYVGVNIYNVVYHNDSLEGKSDFEDPLRLLDYVYNTYSDTKPIVIGEFGATNYTVTDGLFHIDFATEKITRMYKHLPDLYPRVKFIYYFDVNNLVNAPEGRKINNYAITENERITNAYASSIKHDNYLSGVQENAMNEETFSYRDFLFKYKSELFVDVQFAEEYLGVEIKEIDDGTYEASYEGKKFTIKREDLTIDKAAFFEKREIHGVPIEEVLDKLEFEYRYENGDLHIYQ
ncbi:glycoside hydrolase family 26 protein [Oceanobacillus massiliensis]|uniref:glycoside hydrolase family 26 protein n=1 Tax=Oceanobacillus massiliensis TaxID=1465765 RepID=UPI00028A10D7|nr:glycosyl hydrolase [Oceanobacillus massiliensis]